MASEPAPRLKPATLRAAPEPDVPSIVTVTGEGFGPAMTMTLASPLHVFTFGPQSLDRVDAKSFRFDAEPVPDGTYGLTVQSNASRPSNAITLVVRRK